MNDPRNVVEIQLCDDGYEAKIYDNGVSEFGFMPTPFTALCSWEQVISEIQSYNPEHLMVRV
jgi:hypothetical protein